MDGITPETLDNAAARCAPLVHPQTAAAIVATESAGNPFAIGVVAGALLRQPRSKAEAVATARQLEQQGWNFSMGLAQINRHNLARLGLSIDSAFDVCANLQAMQTLLGECYRRAAARRHAGTSEQQVLRSALSCYYSGNFTTGFQHGYVTRVTRASLPWRARPP